MLRIGICTERIGFERYFRELLSGILYSYRDWEVENIPVESLMKGEAEGFLDYQIFCLDEQLLTRMGCDLVKYLNRVRPQSAILLLEGQEEPGIAGIRYRLFAYGINRMRQEELKQIFDLQWHLANSTYGSLSVNLNGTMVQLPIEQILYIESRGRKVLLHTLTGDYEYYEKLYALEELLREEVFIRCHKSFLVSRRHITDYNKEGIWLNQVVIPVGRKYKDSISELFQQDGNLPVSVPTERQGVWIELSGNGQGMVRHFRPEQKIIIGRDARAADIVVKDSKVSRVHCVIVFHEKDNTYDILDLSSNGTFLEGKQRLVLDTIYTVKAGTRIHLGGFDNLYQLG